MRTALGCINVVGKADNRFCIRIVILHRDFNNDIIFFFLNINHIFVQRRFVSIDETDKFHNSSVIFHVLNPAFAALILQHKADAFIQKCLLAHAC